MGKASEWEPKLMIGLTVSPTVKPFAFKRVSLTYLGITAKLMLICYFRKPDNHNLHLQSLCTEYFHVPLKILQF